MSEDEEKKDEKKSRTTLITEKLRTQIKKDLQFDEFDLEGQCRDLPNQIQKYLEMYYSRKRVLDSLKSDADEKFSDYYQRYRYGGKGVSIKADSGSDAKILVNRHDDYRMLLKEIKKMEELVEFLKDTITNLRDKKWLISYVIDIRKMDGTD